jgi:hypothetical protein
VVGHLGCAVTCLRNRRALIKCDRLAVPSRRRTGAARSCREARVSGCLQPSIRCRSVRVCCSLPGRCRRIVARGSRSRRGYRLRLSGKLRDAAVTNQFALLNDQRVHAAEHVREGVVGDAAEGRVQQASDGRPHADVKVRGVHGAQFGHVRPILVRSPPRSRRSGPRPRRSRYRLPAIPRVRAVHAVRRA